MVAYKITPNSVFLKVSVLPEEVMFNLDMQESESKPGELSRQRELKV